MSVHWYNAGRYERECSEFDAMHPLSREVWEAIQRHRRDDWMRLILDTPTLGFGADPTEEFFRVRYRAYIETSCAMWNGAFCI